MEHITIGILQDYILPWLPARDIVRAQLIARLWRDAVLGTPPAVFVERQPPRGGATPLGYHLVNEMIQRRAALGPYYSPSFPPLGPQFDGCRPAIIASSHGFLCIRLEGPAELVVGNPFLPQWRHIPPPFHNGGVPALWETVGLAVFPTEGDGMSATQYFLVSPNMRIQISWNGVLWFDPRQQQAGRFAAPRQLAPHQERTMGDWHGQLAFMAIHGQVIDVYIRQGGRWWMRELIPLLPIVEANSASFDGLRMRLRTRDAETCEQFLDRLVSHGHVFAFAAGVVLWIRRGLVFCHVQFRRAHRMRPNSTYLYR